MKKIRRSMIYLLKIIFSISISLGILSLFTYVYLYDGVHIENETNATDYKWESNQYKATMEEGYVWFRMDENGFNNAYEALDEIDILLMGSSHMEAGNLSPKANVGYKLNELVPDMYTYNIGISGHTIYNCVNNIENAVKLYLPKKYVILETSTVDLDIDNMVAVLENKFERHPSYDSGWLYWLQKNIPATKALYKKLDEWYNCYTENKTVTKVTTEEKQTEQNYSDIVLEFLEKAVLPVKTQDCKLIIFYHPDTKVDENGEWKEYTNKDSLDVFRDACLKKDIVFVDMTEEFKALYEQDHILAHGFINAAVGEGHLNKFGHAIIAQRLTKEIL